jgi:hypothetical protein
MLVVPLSLSQAFEAQLVQRNVPDQQHRDFQKWIRFYLDFCDKYDSKPELTASFAKFGERLLQTDDPIDFRTRRHHRNVRATFRADYALDFGEVFL